MGTLRRSHRRRDSRTGRFVTVREHELRRPPGSVLLAEDARQQLNAAAVVELHEPARLRFAPLGIDALVAAARRAASERTDDDVAVVAGWGPDTAALVPKSYLHELRDRPGRTGDAPATLSERDLREAFTYLEVGSAAPEFNTRIDAAVEAVNDNALFRRTVDRFGVVPISTGRAGRDAAGGHDPSGVLVLLEGSDLPDRSPTLEPGRWAVVDRSWPGVVRHEYAHFAHARVEPPHISAFASCWVQHRSSPVWVEHDAAVARFRVWSTDQGRVPDPAGECTDPEVLATFPGVSSYGARDQTEGFAEAFTAVTHPGYDRHLFHPNAHSMLSVMERIVRSLD